MASVQISFVCGAWYALAGEFCDDDALPRLKIPTVLLQDQHTVNEFTLHSSFFQVLQATVKVRFCTAEHLFASCFALVQQCSLDYLGRQRMAGIL